MNVNINFEELTVRQLKELAKQERIKDWWRLTKENLILELKAVQETKKEVAKINKKPNKANKYPLNVDETMVWKQMKKKTINEGIEDWTPEMVDEIGVTLEIILTNKQKDKLINHANINGIRSKIKYVYAEKGDFIYIFKDKGGVWPLWYKYRDLGYGPVMAFTRDSVEGKVARKPDKRTEKYFHFVAQKHNPSEEKLIFHKREKESIIYEQTDEKL